MQNRVGQQLGNYRLIRLLGQGASAEVYLGRHLLLNSLVAIKILRAHLATEQLGAFLDEARTIASLEHPHIVRVLDCDVKDGSPFIVMSFAPYGSLRTLHSSSTYLSFPQVVSYVQQIADALQYAHKAKIIHRDIKPENMLMSGQHEILVSDFGIATAARSTSSMTAQDVAGTLLYMAPEQINAYPRPASDQYALGVVVYEWLCGQRPFDGTSTELIAKHLHAAPPPLRGHNPTLSSAIEHVILKALAKDPKQRFEHIQDFAIALAEASPSEMSISTQIPLAVFTQPVPPSVSPTGYRRPEAPLAPTVPAPRGIIESTQQTIPPQSRRQTQSHITSKQALPPYPATPHPTSKGASRPHRAVSRRLFVFGLTGAILLGGTYAITHAAALHLVTPFAQSSSSFDYVYKGHAGAVTSIASSPDSKRVASGSKDQTVQVWNITDGSHVIKYNAYPQSDNSEVRAVAWSPDGKRIASAYYYQQVTTWNPYNGKDVSTYKGTGNYYSDGGLANALSWSPDSKYLAAATYYKTVEIWDVTTTALLASYRGHKDNVTGLAWSPDGKHIASISEDAILQVWTVQNLKQIFSYPATDGAQSFVAWSPDARYLASVKGSVLSSTSAVEVRRATNGSLVQTYSADQNPFASMAWSPDSTRIASTSNESATHVWNARTGATLFTHTSEGRPNVAAWSPDGKYVIIGNEDGTVNVWKPQ